MEYCPKDCSSLENVLDEFGVDTDAYVCWYWRDNVEFVKGRPVKNQRCLDGGEPEKG
jgi:hypothetical protein